VAEPSDRKYYDFLVKIAEKQRGSFGDIKGLCALLQRVFPTA